MSLDIDLIVKVKAVHYVEGELSDERYFEEVKYETNFTHNAIEMAVEAGIYEAIWRPYRLLKNYGGEWLNEREYTFERENPVKAEVIIPYLEKGLEKLKSEPEHFKQFDDPNGWGTYEQFVPFVEEYLGACRLYPNSIIKTDR